MKLVRHERPHGVSFQRSSHTSLGVSSFRESFSKGRIQRSLPELLYYVVLSSSYCTDLNFQIYTCTRVSNSKGDFFCCNFISTQWKWVIIFKILQSKWHFYIFLSSILCYIWICRSTNEWNIDSKMRKLYTEYLKDKIFGQYKLRHKNI